METDVLYVIAGFDGSTYGRSHDGVNVYWYSDEQYESAVSSGGPVRECKHFYSHREFDEWRMSR